jgi:cyclophilin family peptidyl-prolyl cis-trans isomerase/HEAT repeat protein
MRPLLDALASHNPEVRAVAVRALGRLESIRFLSDIEPLLADSDATVRMRAAYAVEMVARHEGFAEAYDRLSGRLEYERDSAVLGALAHALGSLRFPSNSLARPAAQHLSRLADTTGSVVLILGVARGFEALFRPTGRDEASSPDAVNAIRALSQYRGGGEDSRAALIRRLAVSALQRIAQPEPASVRKWMTDSDFQVRRLAVSAASALAEPHRREVLERGLQDEHFSVRYAVLRVLTGTPGAGCDYVRPLDANAHVRLLSIDVMAECAGALAPLDSLAGTLASGETWHVAAHALVSLTRPGPERAAARMEAFVRHPVSFVRMYAARAAVQLRDADRLYQLASDRHHNVREVALRGLSDLLGHRADSVYLANLASTDYQLAMTAANVLEGTSHPGAAAALWAAVARLSAEGRETSRDVRMAILSRLGEVGRGDTASLKPYLGDFDPAVASRAGQLLEEWAQRPVRPSPQPLGTLPYPSADRLRALASTHVILHMADGGEITIQLRPDRAPTNAHRFARLAESGYFDGLTFHRLVPNFVIQGGSPGANEYAGDGPFTRDEITGDPHLRGTVGLSTRGRDTGDGQIFINLVDNYRLDADYTLFGDVLGGMEVVDRVLEGAEIVRSEVRQGMPR